MSVPIAVHGVDTAVNGIGDDTAEIFGFCLLPFDDLPSLPLDLWSGSGASGLPHDPPLAIAKLQFLSPPPTFEPSSPSMEHPIPRTNLNLFTGHTTAA